jgi:hypothetical protein
MEKVATALEWQLCILPINIYIIRTIPDVLIYLMGQICQENWY